MCAIPAIAGIAHIVLFFIISYTKGVRFLFALLSLLGFTGLGLMVFLTDPLQLNTLEFFLFYASFFIALGSLFTLLVLLRGQNLRRDFADAVRLGVLFGAAITFLLFLQSMRTLNVVTFVAIVSIAAVAELLFRAQKRIRKNT